MNVDTKNIHGTLPQLIEHETQQSVAQRAVEIRHEALVINAQLYKKSLSLTSSTIRLNHLEERTGRVQFWKRRNALRDIRRLHSLRQATQDLSEEVRDLRERLSGLEKEWKDIGGQ